MANLLKSDLYRFFKSKQFIIISIIVLVFAVMVPLLNYVADAIIERLQGSGYIGDLRSTSSAFASMQSALNPGSLFGFLLPIFVGVVLASDFKDGTIRNKIITGVSKEKIHLSNYLASLIFIVACMIGYGLLAFLVSLIFYNVVPSNVEAGMFIGNLFLTLLFDIIYYCFIASVILLLVMLFRSVGLSSFMYILLLFAFQFVGGIIMAIISAIELYETNMDGLINFLNVLLWINPFYLMGVLTISDYSTALIVSNIITPIIWGTINFFLAYLLLKKKDIK